MKSSSEDAKLNHIFVVILVSFSFLQQSDSLCRFFFLLLFFVPKTAARGYKSPISEEEEAEE